MPPGTETAIDAAAHRGYESVVLVIVVLCLVGLVALLFRWFISSMDQRLIESRERENRLANRVSELEKFAENTLLKLVETVTQSLQKNTEAMNNLTKVLDERPCLLSRDAQDVLVTQIAKRVAEEAAEEAEE